MILLLPNISQVLFLFDKIQLRKQSQYDITFSGNNLSNLSLNF